MSRATTTEVLPETDKSSSKDQLNYLIGLNEDGGTSDRGVSQSSAVLGHYEKLLQEYRALKKEVGHVMMGPGSSKVATNGHSTTTSGSTAVEEKVQRCQMLRQRLVVEIPHLRKLLEAADKGISDHVQSSPDHFNNANVGLSTSPVAASSKVYKAFDYKRTHKGARQDITASGEQRPSVLHRSESGLGCSADGKAPSQGGANVMANVTHMLGSLDSDPSIADVKNARLRVAAAAALEYKRGKGQKKDQQRQPAKLSTSGLPRGPLPAVAVEVAQQKVVSGRSLEAIMEHAVPDVLLDMNNMASSGTAVVCSTPVRTATGQGAEGLSVSAVGRIQPTSRGVASLLADPPQEGAVEVHVETAKYEVKSGRDLEDIMQYSVEEVRPDPLQGPARPTCGLTHSPKENGSEGPSSASSSTSSSVTSGEKSDVLSARGDLTVVLVEEAQSSGQLLQSEGASPQSLAAHNITLPVKPNSNKPSLPGQTGKSGVANKGSNGVKDRTGEGGNVSGGAGFPPGSALPVGA